MSEIRIINPATETICGRYPLMDLNQVDAIIQAMHFVQKEWAESSIQTRSDCFSKLAELLLAEKQEAAQLITQEMGKPISQALAEVEKCARLCLYYAQEGEVFLKPQNIHTEFYKSYCSFHPLGIIFAIMPWNFPFWQVFRFAVPNLMVGNAALLKHAPNSMGAGLYIEKLFLKAGFPKDLFHNVIVDIDAVPFIIHHPHIAGVTLTGSNKAGKAVAAEAGNALKKLVLELGGNDPYLILEDADLDLAAEQSVLSRLNNAGQVCIAAKRLIVAEAVKKEFEALVLEKAKKYHCGDPTDPKTLLGPMAREDLRMKIDEQVRRSITDGAHCLLGGTMPKGKGYYYPATVLSNVSKESPAFQEEMFGPVICITSVKNEEEAIALANKSPFGLAGAVFTRDLKRGEKIAREGIHTGTCAVNVQVKTDPRLPFGGIKQSGYGRELGLEGMREFVNIKTIIVAKD